ncbi:hypothetical protein A9P82_01170 [Arachidicoccus ginsenosidimutans]|uniref:hypothetical protein n=1 Tax=Arachidicoccus sp. BS20 TaxID=1850526 RepID=UPI0007F06B5B|nr:hypothetical protein [Arachidicoccus sp. BS20]ANI88051.1 hypothetical protein A9P82_01170 [Arachidicoccus sp. BS20]
MGISVPLALRKIFVHGFYRVHAGMLVFLFTAVLSCCFFVNTLGELPPGSYFFWHYVITITLVSNPVMMLVFFVLCMFYAFKNLQFIDAELQKSNNRFLFYSMNALKKKEHFKVWFVIQLYVFLPLIIYTSFSVIIGFFTRHYFTPFLFVIYILLLAACCAMFIVKNLNNVGKREKSTVSNLLFKKWHKPFFTLYTYHVLHRLKGTYVVTKIISALIILTLFYNYPDLKEDIKTSCLIVTLIVIAHSVIIFQEQIFNNKYLLFSYNFPYSKTKLFFAFIINYLLILFPEIFWFFIYFSIGNALLLLFFALSVLLLLRSISYASDIKLQAFLKVVFLMLAIIFLVIIYGFFLLVPPVCFVLAFIIFRTNYFYKSVE